MIISSKTEHLLNNNQNNNRIRTTLDTIKRSYSDHSSSNPTTKEPPNKTIKITSKCLVPYSNDSSEEEPTSIKSSHPISNGFVRILPHNFNGPFNCEKRFKKMKKNKKKHKKKKHLRVEWIERTKETLEKEGKFKQFV
jgi:hypothetical protein